MAQFSYRFKLQPNRFFLIGKKYMFVAYLGKKMLCSTVALVNVHMSTYTIWFSRFLHLKTAIYWIASCVRHRDTYCIVSSGACRFPPILITLPPNRSYKKETLGSDQRSPWALYCSSAADLSIFTHLYSENQTVAGFNNTVFV